MWFFVVAFFCFVFCFVFCCFFCVCFFVVVFIRLLFCFDEVSNTFSGMQNTH